MHQLFIFRRILLLLLISCDKKRRGGTVRGNMPSIFIASGSNPETTERNDLIVSRFNLLWLTGVRLTANVSSLSFWTGVFELQIPPWILSFNLIGVFCRERPAAIPIEIKSIDDTSNFDEFPDSDILTPSGLQHVSVQLLMFASLCSWRLKPFFFSCSCSCFQPGGGRPEEQGLGLH